jgi:hypothetical protein
MEKIKERILNEWGWSTFKIYRLSWRC